MHLLQAVFQSEYTEEVPLYRSLGKEATTTFFNDNNRKIDFVLVFQDQTGRAKTPEPEPESSGGGVMAAAQAFKYYLINMIFV